MTTIAKDKKTIAALYGKADKSAKSLLDEIFGEKFFQPIMDRIKSWEDAASEKGIDPLSSLPYPKPTDSRQEAVNAFYMLDIIAELLNEGMILDWTDGDQRKWFPYFNDYTSGAGFRFPDSSYGWTYSGAYGGARLCVHSKEISDYFGKQFLPIWNKFLNPNK